MIYKKKVIFVVSKTTKNKKCVIQTKIIIDYDTAVELIESMGEQKFVDLLNNVVVITVDEDSYYFINEIKRKLKDENKIKSKKSRILKKGKDGL